MVQLTRIYTKGGDKGKTSLGTGQRVMKCHDRINAIGEVDEANAAIGWAKLYANHELEPVLNRVQNDLFDLGADLCFPDKPPGGLSVVPSQVDYLEQQIDEINKRLPSLTSFNLPGGSKASAALHLARTIVRRAERSVIKLNQKEPLNEEVIKYLNRLSDLLFVMCRHLNDDGKSEILWVPGKSRGD